MWEVLLDALLDSIKVFPFILLIYVLMEVIEGAKNKEKIEKVLSGGVAPVFAGTLGVVPECGFAVMCSKLYEKGLIRTGTLIAAFLAVSDEGLIVLATGGDKWYNILLFVGIKVVYAIIVGEILNAIFKSREINHICPDDGDCIECGKHQENKLHQYFLHPLFHALKTVGLILVVSIVIGIIIFLIGEDKLGNFLNNNVYYQPLISSLIGLIPNCVSSVIISQAYIEGVLIFPALMAGLCANAGLGMIILFRNRTMIKRNIVIIVLTYFFSILLGYILLPFYI
ncbi:MAG: arsenic efflux protein [Clostridia bacterium]|nr:arsenic efflux protein [Clostridia bacterium]